MSSRDAAFSPRVPETSDTVPRPHPEPRFMVSSSASSEPDILPPPTERPLTRASIPA